MLTCRLDRRTVHAQNTGNGPDQQTSPQDARDPPHRLAETGPRESGRHGLCRSGRHSPAAGHTPRHCPPQDRQLARPDRRLRLVGIGQPQRLRRDGVDAHPGGPGRAPGSGCRRTARPRRPWLHPHAARQLAQRVGPGARLHGPDARGGGGRSLDHPGPAPALAPDLGRPARSAGQLRHRPGVRPHRFVDVVVRLWPQGIRARGLACGRIAAPAAAPWPTGCAPPAAVPLAHRPGARRSAEPVPAGQRNGLAGRPHLVGTERFSRIRRAVLVAAQPHGAAQPTGTKKRSVRRHPPHGVHVLRPAIALSALPDLERAPRFESGVRPGQRRGLQRAGGLVEGQRASRIRGRGRPV